jgi:hypothetical protein
MADRLSGRRVGRRRFLAQAAAGAVGLSLGRSIAWADSSGELLYNGIRLPRPWPPRLRSLPLDPTTPPYLLAPPPVVPIDVGRQLFVDDFLIEATSLTRTFHRVEYYGGNPIVSPSTTWERYDEYAERTKTRSNPAAMVFSDGVLFDPADRLFKMWYMGGYKSNTCYAISHDGLKWERPSLDVVRGTNIVISKELRDSNTIWLDHNEKDPARRFKMASFKERSLILYSSPDGIHWTIRGESGPTGDRSTVFYNPFRRKWVYSLRDEQLGGFGRFRRYWEHDDFFEGARWTAGEPVFWSGADSAEQRRPGYGARPQLYNLDAVAYESVLLGLFTIWRGETLAREKPNDVCVGFSRDGFHWWRPDRRPFIPVSEQVGAWNWANVQTAGGCCLVVGDRLYFYVSGRTGVPGTQDPGTCATGVAMLRRDGFASMDVPDAAAPPRRTSTLVNNGELLTRPVQFTGGHLFVNADLAGGTLRAAVEDASGRVIPGFELGSCIEVRGNGTAMAVRWPAASLNRLAGTPVRFRFALTAGRLYAFWVSAAPSGESGGYVAAGGPAFKGPRDQRT